MKPLKVGLTGGYTMFTPGLPSGGPIAALILKAIGGRVGRNVKTVTGIHRIVEAFKYAYARRGDIGDPDFINGSKLINNIETYGAEINKLISDSNTVNSAAYYRPKFRYAEDHGTSHLSVMSPNGDAVSITSTINVWFGATFVSKSTGIILNNEMGCFSAFTTRRSNENFLYSPYNSIAPGKRPASSMAPTIIVNSKGEIALIIGGSGGHRIPTIIALVVLRHFWYNLGINKAINEKRYHHQLWPMQLDMENEYNIEAQPKSWVKALERLGHKINFLKQLGGLTAIVNKNGKLFAGLDKRKHSECAYV